MRIQRLSGSLCALLVVGLLVAALARGEWTEPLDLSAAGQNASSLRVAVDVDGDAVFTWQRSDGTNQRTEARALSAAGNLSAVLTLSAAGQNAAVPRVAVDADGDAVFTWTRFDGSNSRVEARTRSAAGTLSAVQTLSAAGQNATSPQVAVDADGDAVFTWTRFDGTTGDVRVQTRARSAAGALGAVQTLSAAGQSAIIPQVAVDADGDAVFTWLRSDGAKQRVEARARSAAGALSAVQILSASGQNANVPRVAVDADGDAVFTWQRFDGTLGIVRAQARARSAAGALSVVQNLSEAGGSGGFQPHVDVDADGDAVFTWDRAQRIEARARSAAGALSAVQTLSDPGQIAGNPEVAVDADGDAMFTWRRQDGTHSRVEARRRTAAGTLRPFTTLSDPGQHASLAQVAVDDEGDAVVSWQRSDGANERAQASAGP